MNQSELIDRVLAGTAFERRQVKIILRKTLDTITRELARGDCVKLAGFGTFKVTKFAERKAVNPNTGEPIIIPACMRPTFRPGTKLKEAVKC